MDLTEYISITGQSGLFKVIAKSTNGLIVESLLDNKRIHVSASQKVSTLQDISIFTTNEDIPLSEVFQKIYEKENGSPAINHKADSKDIKNYFQEVLPEYDEERVYASDMKKVIQWYNILQSQSLLKPAEKAEAGKEENTEGDEKPAKAKTAAKTGKQAAKPKSAAPKTSKAKAAKTQTVRKTGA
ncbi:MAG: DUF5606 domain-containing protein [Bacteroidetes bacterium]|nr:DUF5606 domain-containing protein [Bacteroidota bacterium]